MDRSREGTTAAARAPEGLATAGFDAADPRVSQLAQVVQGLRELPRHRSIHGGGFILT